MALDRAHPAAGLFRSTTGQSLAVHYDRRSNTIEITETDWSAEGFRTGIVPRAVVRERLTGSNVLRLKRRR